MKIQNFLILREICGDIFQYDASSVFLKNTPPGMILKNLIFFAEMWKYLTFITLIFTPASLALQIPKWSDVFSSLEPYKDPETLLLEEEDGEPRLGFVQV